MLASVHPSRMNGEIAISADNVLHKRAQSVAGAHANSVGDNIALCSRCAIRHTCVSGCVSDELGKNDLMRLDEIIHSWRKVYHGDALYRTGDPFQSIYIVRIGSFKNVVVHRGGYEQVTGFFFTGEPLGMEGIATGKYTSEAIALEDSRVCVIPFHRLERLCREVHALQHHVYRMMSSEIVRESNLLFLVANMSAEERVASFLLNVSQRLHVRGYSATEFLLRMTRDDMGSYLGMKHETVSRTLSKFQELGLIRVQGKHIKLLDVGGLARCAPGPATQGGGA